MANKYGEPWIGASGRGEFRYRNTKTFVCLFDQEVNARIVACVNAMAGVEDPAAFVRYARQLAVKDEAGTLHDKWKYLRLTPEDHRKWFDSLSAEEQESLIPDK